MRNLTTKNIKHDTELKLTNKVTRSFKMVLEGRINNSNRYFLRMMLYFQMISLHYLCSFH